MKIYSPGSFILDHFDQLFRESTVHISLNYRKMPFQPAATELLLLSTYTIHTGWLRVFSIVKAARSMRCVKFLLSIRNNPLCIYIETAAAPAAPSIEQIVLTLVIAIENGASVNMTMMKMNEESKIMVNIRSNGIKCVEYLLSTLYTHTHTRMCIHSIYSIQNTYTLYLTTDKLIFRLRTFGS